ncbi:hypothetical protein FRC06_009348, partial [Ceratobasidium sp. 370]
MTDVSDLSVYVQVQNCCVLDHEDTVLAEAQGLLQSAKSAPHVHSTSPADDSKQIARDAVGVLQAFEDISAELGVTNDVTFKTSWDNNYKTYRDLLQDTVKLAEQGSNYIQGFYDTVVSRFGKDDVDWEKDKDLIADFVKNNGGQQIVDQTAQASQKFTDLKHSTQAFHEQYAANATNKGQAYNATLKQMDDDRRKLQARIDRYDNPCLSVNQADSLVMDVPYSNRTSAAQLRSSMRRTAGPGFLLGWLVRAVLTVLGIGTFNMANDRIGSLEREEQQLVNERAALDQRADAIAKQESALVQTRHAVSVLADNVSDLSVRLSTLAQTWAEAHANFVALGQLLQNATESLSRASFMRRLNLIAESTSALTANMRAYINEVAPCGVMVKPVKKVRPPTYDISRMYGGSDRGGGASAFDDTQADLHPTMSIADIFVVSGWVVDAIHVVYRLKNGGSRRVNHGSNRAGSQIVVGPTEYVSAVWGRSGRADNGQTWMGDCVQQISFEITNSTNGAKRTAGPYGQAFKLSAAATTNILWRGRLLCFGGTANNGASQVGLRGIKFIQL